MTQSTWGPSGSRQKRTVVGAVARAGETDQLERHQLLEELPEPLAGDATSST